MLRSATICIMLLAASAMGWERLTDVPYHVDVDFGTHLIWGDTLLWGVFPSTGSPDATYLGSYHPGFDEDSAWDTLRISGVPLGRTGIAFQWVERPVVWAMGKDNPGISRLYQYDVRTGVTTQETLNSRFMLDIGAAITFVPNEGYHPYYWPTAGALYFLPGDGKTFWRRWVTAKDMPDPLIYGYEYPGDEVTIVDPTPTFRWTPSATTQYRLQVATDLNFTNNVIDTVVPTSECQSTVEMDSGTYYWRVATWVQGSGGGDSTWAFINLPLCTYVHPSYNRLDSLDVNARSGAKLAYFIDTCDYEHQAVLAIYGGTSRCFAEYDIEQNSWTRLHNVPKDMDNSASLTTDAAVGGKERIYTAFDDDVENGCPHYYTVPPTDAWRSLDDDDTSDIYNTHFPDDINAGSSMALGAIDMMYLTTGNVRRFYGVSVSRFPGGQQSRVVLGGKARARGVTVSDGIEVEYQLPAAAHVRASLHDALGRRVGTLDAGVQSAGLHRLGWNRNNGGSKLAAGAYFVSLDLGAARSKLKAVIR